MKRILALLSIVFLTCAPLITLAQPDATPSAPVVTTTSTTADAAPADVPTEPPGPEIDAGEAAEGMMEGVNTSQVTLIIGSGLMIFVLILRRYVWKKLQDRTEWLPYLAVGIATLGTVGVALVADPLHWVEALLAGIQAGVGAGGTWGLFGVIRKRLNPK